MENDPYNVDQSEGPAPMDEQLVAYLDGELDDESSRQIEQRLTSDSTLRDQLTQLERAWNALDELEQVEVDEGFTKTTIEMVALAAEEEHQQEEAQRPARQLRRWLIGSAGLAAACLAGFVGVWGFSPDDNQQLIKDLPIIEKLDEYQQIDDIEFLLLLHEKKLFAAEAEGVSASSAAAMVVGSGAGGSGDIEDKDYQQRRVYIENLDEGTKEKLSEKDGRFRDLSRDEKEKLRDLHRALQAHPNREELEQVMEAYYEWVLDLPGGIRARLNNEASPEERIKQVIRYKGIPHHRGGRFGGPGGFPWPSMRGRSPERILASKLLERYSEFKSWAGQLVADRSSQLAELLPDHEKEKWKRSVRDALATEVDQETALWRSLARWYLATGPEQELPLNENDILDLKSRLSADKAKDPFADVASDRQVQVMNSLLRGFVREQLSWELGDLKGVVTRDELEEYVERNPEAKKDLHPDKDFRTYQIRRRYVESRLGASRSWSDGRPRGPGLPDGGSRRGGPPGPGQGSRGGSRPSFGDPHRGPNMPNEQKPPGLDRLSEPR